MLAQVVSHASPKLSVERNVLQQAAPARGGRSGRTLGTARGRRTMC